MGSLVPSNRLIVSLLKNIFLASAERQISGVLLLLPFETRKAGVNLPDYYVSNPLLSIGSCMTDSS